MCTNRKPHQFYLQDMPRMPPRLPALVPGPGWFLQPSPLLSSSLTLNCLYSTQQPAGSLLKLSQIMSFLCSNLPIFRSEEELKSLQAAWDFTPHFPDLLSHFFTPPPPSAPATVTALLFLKQVRHGAASGPLHRLCPVPGPAFTGLSAWSFPHIKSSGKCCLLDEAHPLLAYILSPSSLFL